MAPGYERIPQSDDALSLHTVSSTYNYGTGIPNSSPPSFHSSAPVRPPYFYTATASRILGSNSHTTQYTPTHTTDSPACHLPHVSSGAPLTSGALAALPEDGNMHGAPPSYHPEDLLDTRSLAGSFHDGASTNLGGADPLTHNLHKRITRLEEALGRVLLQNEQLLSAVREANGGEGIAGAEGGRKKRTNCCVSISEDESGGYSEMDNCCVSIGRRRSNIERERTLKIWIAGLVGIVGLVAVIVLIVVGSVNGKQPRYADDGR